jgi:glycosyltransferase involved in cell wall biosynthesis
LRVALVHWSYPPTTGGVESHLADMARLLAHLGCRVVVLTGELGAEPSTTFDVVEVPQLNLARIRNGEAGSVSALRTAFTNLIRSFRVDIVHGHNLHHFSSAPALALHELRRTLGFRLHHTFHETWPDLLNDTRLYDVWEGNYAVSHFIGAQCRERIGIQPTVFPLGIDVDRFVPRRGPRGSRQALTILHPARLLPWKGVHISVAMLSRLRSRGIPARLVLTDTQRIVDWNIELVAYRESVMELIDQLNLEDAVTLRTVGYDEMPALYAEADVVVYPTVGDEPFGLVPLEAMSCGLPIVASNSGGIPETVVDGETGFIVPRGDVHALTDRVLALTASAELRARLGRAGRRRVAKHFSLQRYVSTLCRLYTV